MMHLKNYLKQKKEKKQKLQLQLQFLLVTEVETDDTLKTDPVRLTLMT